MKRVTKTKSKTSQTPIIRLENVWKIYKMGEVEVPAVKGLNLDINKGEFVSIMGPSGSGKSTTMNMVGCLDIPTKGKIFLSGQNIAHLEESDLAQIRGKTIGFIFQQFNLISTLTALENVTLPMIFQGISQTKREKRAAKLLGLVKLKHRMFHKPSELSGGEQQRVAIARALCNDPEIILADEPTGNLDSKAGQQVMDMLMTLHKKEKKTIILVTHDVHLVKYSTKTIRLKDGEVMSISNNNK